MLWRHGRTRWNAEHRFQGQTDVELDDTGREQAQRAAALLTTLEPSVLVSSDLRRARDTAAELAQLTGLDVASDEGLRETYAGQWQGLTADEIAEQFTDELAAWRSGDPQARPGGGENRLEVAERAVAAVGRALARVPERGTLVVATHGGAARVAIGRMLGLDASAWGVLGGLSNCCWSVLHERRDGGWRLFEHNAGSLPQPVLSQEG